MGKGFTRSKQQTDTGDRFKQLVTDIVENRAAKTDDVVRFNYNANIEVAKQVFTHLARNKFEPNFKMTSQNINLYKFIIDYALGRDLDNHIICGNNTTPDKCKALGLMGNTGSGKTLVMQIFREFCKIDGIKYAVGGKVKNFVPVMISARRIVNEFNSHGYAALDTICSYDSLIIDDLGAENQTVKYYGSEVDVIEYVIEERYALNNMTHFTTNLNFAEIEDVYGERVRSRLYQRTNLIKITVSDHRMK